VTVTSDRTNVNVPQIGACLPLPGSLALQLGAQHGQLDADLGPALSPYLARLRYDYYTFALEDEGRLAPMAAELVDCLEILVAASRFLGMGVADSHSLRFVRMQHFVVRSTYVPFRGFWGDVCAAKIHVASF
jgi:hypothetical protein